jgi:hypothetical protein
LKDAEKESVNNKKINLIRNWIEKRHQKKIASAVSMTYTVNDL